MFTVTFPRAQAAEAAGRLGDDEDFSHVAGPTPETELGTATRVTTG